MPTFGLTTDGFQIKSLSDIREDLNDALRNAFGASIDLGDRSIFGQIVGIFAERLSVLWELAQAVHSSQDPDKATGQSLDAICALTGTFRPPATKSTVVLTLTGNPATAIPTGSQAATTSTSKSFDTLADVTLVLLDDWAGTTAYVVGDRVTNNDNTYECITAGTSAGSGGPTTEDEDITDGTVHWTFLGAGTAAEDVTASSSDTGPITGFARDITTIVTSVSGWDGVINLLDATPGSDLASDEELRELREEELATPGTSTIDAIRAALLDIADMISVKVFVNNTDDTDVDGLPPHSIEALVRTSWVEDVTDDQIILDTLLANVAAGIVTYGTTSGTAEDSQGTTHTVKFSRPTESSIYIDMDVTVDEDLFPADGAQQIKEAIVLWGDAQDIGKDAVASAISARAFQIDGVLDVTQCFIDDAPAPASSATVVVGVRGLAVYDTTRIAVTVTPGTP